MQLVHGHPLQQITEVDDPAELYDKLMNLMLKFANHVSFILKYFLKKFREII